VGCRDGFFTGFWFCGILVFTGFWFLRDWFFYRITGFSGSTGFQDFQVKFIAGAVIFDAGLRII
jgi:hypothetical protein